MITCFAAITNQPRQHVRVKGSIFYREKLDFIQYTCRRKTAIAVVVVVVLRKIVLITKFSDFLNANIEIKKSLRNYFGRKSQ